MAELLARCSWGISGLGERFAVWHMFGRGYFAPCNRNAKLSPLGDSSLLQGYIADLWNKSDIS